MKDGLKKYAPLGIIAFIVAFAIVYWSGIVGIGVAILYALTPLLGGVIIAYIVNIPMSFYERIFFGRFKNKLVQRIKRTICMLLSFATVIAIVFVVVVLILPELTDCINLIIKHVPPYLQKTYIELEEKYEISSFVSANLLKQFEDIKGITDVVSKALEWLYTGFGNVVGSLFSVLSAVVSTVFSVFMSFVFAIYLLASKETLSRGFKKLGDAYLKEKTYYKLVNIAVVTDESFRRFIVGQCTEAMILGILCIIGMNLFGFPYATMIGTLVGFTALIPIAGAFIGAGIGAIMIMASSNWLTALLFVVFIVVLQQLEGNLIYPKVVGASIGLPGIWVLAAVTLFGSLGGIPAMIIGVPIVATVYRLLRDDANEKIIDRASAEEKEDDEKSDASEALTDAPTDLQTSVDSTESTADVDKK